MAHVRPARLVRCAAIAAALLALAGCVTSDKPLLGPETRALPFTAPAKFQVFERTSADEAWRKRSVVTLVADKDKVVRVERDSDTYTFHPLGANRFLVQGRFGIDGRYAYAVLAVRNGEGVLSVVTCADVDQAAFEAAGATIRRTDGELPECRLDTARDPQALLRMFAETRTANQQRYVPVK